MKRFSIVKLMTGLMAFFFLSVFLHGQSEGGAICGTTPCIDSADIINGQVTGADISSSVVVPGSRIVDGSVTGVDIQDGSLTGTDIQDGAVTGTDIQDGSIGGADINSVEVQKRVTGTCAAGSSIRVIAADGTVTCEADASCTGDITGVAAGTGLTGGGTSGDVSLSIATGGVGTTQIADSAVSSAKIAAGSVGTTQINNTQVQSRVSGTCPAGSSISTINADGTVVCETDDVGGGGGWTDDGTGVRLTTNTDWVGIGTASPSEQLHITGNLRLPSTTATTGIIKSGDYTLIHTYGSNNFFAGVNAGNLTMTGFSNTASGVNSLYSNTTGNYNTASGAYSLLYNTTGNSNTASGYGSLYSNTTGYYNTASGQGSPSG